MKIWHFLSEQLWIQDFPWGWGGMDPLGGHGPLMWVSFGENVCENERIGSSRGGVPGRPTLDLPMLNDTKPEQY